MTCNPGMECEEAHHPDHAGHDQWHLISDSDRIWCRTCQREFRATEHRSERGAEGTI